MSDLSYWDIRTMLLDAIARQDDACIERISQEYPEIFNNVVAQAKNANKRRKTA